MKLEAIRLRNFRGYIDATMQLDDLTAIVGRNDAGKSTVLDALAIFFGAKGAKMDATDLNKHNTMATSVEIRCMFSELPDALVIDDSATTRLEDEFLLNAEGQLEIVKRWKFSGKTQQEIYAHALHPRNKGIHDLLQQKIDELKSRVEKHGLTVADKRKAPLLRKALFDAVPDKDLALREVPLFGDGDGKKLWEKLEGELPLLCVFKADRSTSDEDAEAQDPMVLAVREALKELDDELQRVSEHVRQRVQDVATRTVQELARIDSALAAELSPTFKSEPKWDGLFKLSLTGDKDIPLNKRGSGVRRLVLLSFLLAEVDRRRQQGARSQVIYAIEEPETALHPKQQALLVETLRRLSQTADTQVILTTHSPSLAGLLPHRSLRLVSKDPELGVATVDASPGTVERVATELGVLPDPERRKVCVVVCVEGPSDVTFLQRASQILRHQDPSLPDLTGADSRILVLPLGGGTLTHWVENRYLRHLRIPEVHIYDRDDQQPPKYQSVADDVNARGDGSQAFLTKKRELENYYHPDSIYEVAGVRVTLTDQCDACMVVAQPAHEDRNPGQPWANLSDRDKRNRAKRIKSELANTIADRLTYDRLVATGFADEFKEWSVPVLAALSPP
jgi:predicted ATP-dependent endonuclease of OLD family